MHGNKSKDPALKNSTNNTVNMILATENTGDGGEQSTSRNGI